MDRISRQIANSKQDRIQIVKSQPSGASLREGQEVIYVTKDNRIARYRKEQGRVWVSYMNSNENQIVDGDLIVKRNLNVNGDITGGQISFFNHNYNTTSAALRYLPWGSISEAASIYYYNNIIAPYSGRLLKVLVRCNTDIDTVIVGFHKSPDETEAPNTTATETITLEMGTDDITTEFKFTSTSVFDAGDVIAISIDPENVPNDVKVTSVWLFNTTI
tara:strand:+ start:445 stop:1098 length:654 start_codon:yes stop_codon:yes gene_type:complete